MPQGAWLGVHLTLDVAGRAKFGPDIEWVDDLDYRFDDPNGERRATFEREIRRYWPGLPDGALVPDYTGIRPKIYREGEPAGDFTIHGEKEHGLPGLVALYGIESPGLDVVACGWASWWLGCWGNSESASAQTDGGIACSKALTYSRSVASSLWCMNAWNGPRSSLMDACSSTSR